MRMALLLALSFLAPLGTGCAEDLGRPELYPAPGFVAEWGKKLNVPGRLTQPVGIAVGPGRRVYVGDSDQDLIRIYTEEGVYLDSLVVDISYSALFVDDESTIHTFSNAFGGPYRRLDLDGNPVDQQGFSGVRSMAQNLQGIRFILGNYSDSTGNHGGGVWRVVDPGLPESWSQVPVPLSALLGVDREGNLTVVSGYGVDGITYSVLEQFSPDGRFLGKYPMGGAGVQPSALQVDRFGNLIIINDRERALEKYSPQGKLLVRWTETDADHEPLLWPSGLAIDDEDNLYVTDWTRPRVVKFKN
jgi:hypothetical protein